MSDSMWHEARRQERRIKGMLVDYRRRAERRRDFYERIKADPTQFLQVHGRQCKIHLDPSVAAAADSATAMMPWQGDPDNLIDRFDVRAHLDFIPVVKKDEEEELSQEERQLNYERYRIIAQNSFLALSEEKFLKQLHIEEQFGYTENKERKKDRSAGVAIGFNYEDGSAISQPQPAPDTNEDESEHSDSDLDVDLSINVSKMDPAEAHEMNRHGRNYGMSSNDFYSFLIKDLDEAESYRLAKEEEHEKALYAGRKSRRERRAHREKRLANRVISPPSYAARKSPDYTAFRQSKSPSKSPTPDNAGKITYITSFGDEEETPFKPSYADKVKMTKSRKRENSSDRFVYSAKSSESSKRKRSHSRSSRSNSRQRRSKSRERYRKRSRSRSRSKTRSSSISRSSSARRIVYRGRKSRSSSSSSSSSRSPKKARKSSSSSSSSSSDREPKKSRSKSRSPSIKKESPPKQIPRYYGRRKSDHSSSELSDSDHNEKEEKEMTNSNKTTYGNSGSSIKKSTGTAPSASAVSFQERLKRKRQALLNKQFKADKIAEMTKAEREKQEQQTREDELREMGIKLRKRQREKRHAYDSDSSASTHSSTVQSRSSKKDAEENKSRSQSPSLKKEEPDIKRSNKVEESRESYTRRKSPVRYEEKRTVQREEKDRYDRGRREDRDRRDDRDRREDRDRRYNRDRRDERGRWEERDRDRRNDREKRDDRNRRDDRDRRNNWRSRDSSRRDRYGGNSDSESNSKPIRSLVDY